jgi:hypothetical protein
MYSNPKVTEAAERLRVARQEIEKEAALVCALVSHPELIVLRSLLRASAKAKADLVGLLSALEEGL